MRIASIAAGAAGMYCGSCLHDNTLAAALLAAGHDVALIPTYTPLRTDEDDVSIRKIFYGAVNVYLQQKLPLFRRTPRSLDRLLDRPGLLSLVSRLGASTDAAELGELTLSVLRGESGSQRKELERLVDWLRDFQPEVVQVANSMFLGFVRSIRRELEVPVVCGLTGEDLFLEGLPEAVRGRVREELRRRARDAQGFIATSRYYARVMEEYLDVPGERIHVVPLGIQVDDCRPGPPREGGEPPVVGYLARICPEKGLHLLVEALALIHRHPRGEGTRLRIAGYLSKRDRPYLEETRRRIGALGLEEAVEILGEVDRKQKLELLRSLDVLSVPTTYQEPKGLYVLEALAHAVPVVQPRHGAFPELVESTGGGLLVEPGSAEALADGLLTLIQSPDRRRALGRAGRKAVEERFSDRAMAAATLEVYRRVRDSDT